MQPQRTPHMLLCPPQYFGIEYEINPWMHRSEASDPARARRQWQALHDTLIELGVQVHGLDPVPGLPDLVFTANAGLIAGSDRVVVSRFKHPERQGETPHVAAWFRAHGFEVLEPPPGLCFEGAGDALFCGETLFAGYRHRSDARVHEWLATVLGAEVLPVELVDPRFYHLDTCFCPLAPGQALYYPGAFDAYGRAVLADRIPDLIAVSSEEAGQFGCNAVVVGRTVILNEGAPRLTRALERSGYGVRPLAFSEFLKSGGSAKCLTLRLDGEEAVGRDGQGFPTSLGTRPLPQPTLTPG